MFSISMLMVKAHSKKSFCELLVRDYKKNGNPFLATLLVYVLLVSDGEV